MNLDESVVLAPGVHWVGSGTRRCNAYLLVGSDRAALIDPGPLVDLPAVLTKVFGIVRPQQLTAVVVHDARPDVIGALSVLEGLVPGGLEVFAHPTTCSLLMAAGTLHRSHLVRLDRPLQVGIGAAVQFVPTLVPMPGGMMTFEPASRTLFSGAMFGAETTPLFADDAHLPGCLERWHRQMMPGRDVVRDVLDVIDALGPSRICPQRGSVLQPAAQIARVTRHLRDLPCGHDLELAAP